MTSFAKLIRYGKEECASIGPITETSGPTRNELRQIPMTLSYGLTIHKCQGITLPVSYPSLSGIFGFGMPYTLLTRTPFSDCMLFVGVPPKDVLDLLLQRDNQGRTCLDRKRLELIQELKNPYSVEQEVTERLQKGEFDLHSIGSSLLADLPESKRSGTSVNLLAYEHLCSRLRLWKNNWINRLTAEHGLQAMVKVSDGFKYKDGKVQPYRAAQGGHRPWFTLADALQGDSIERRRIQFYKRIATEWMAGQGVNVLAKCRLNEGCFPERINQENGRSVISAYTIDGIRVQRPCFPSPPEGFQWGSGKSNPGSRAKETRLEQPSATCKHEEAPTASSEVQGNESSTNTPMHGAQALKRKAMNMENVISQVDDRNVKVHRVNKRLLSGLANRFRQQASIRHSSLGKQVQAVSKRRRCEGSKCSSPTQTSAKSSS